MKQRFGIAQALLGDPRLIILDEPTAGLDPAERESLNNLLVSMSKNRLILLSTHIVEDIENQCHFVAMIKGGQLIQSGHIDNLVRQLKGKVWVLKTLPSALPKGALVLSQSYRYGEPVFRVYAAERPTTGAVLATESLQDKYFFELKFRRGNLC